MALKLQHIIPKGGKGISMAVLPGKTSLARLCPRHEEEWTKLSASTSTRGPKQKATSAAAPPTLLSVLFPVPLEILEEIFLNLPADQVVCICRLVCHQWKEVADSESLWRERCRREGYRLCDASKIPKDWRLFYFLCKKRRNLLKNPRGEQDLNGWQILENGGDRWVVEGVRVPHPDEKVQKNFLTSYGLCRKSQLIDLEKEGYNPSFMDHLQPEIRISDWYSPRTDCGSKYELCIELLNQRKRPVQTFAPETVYFQQWNDQKWNQMTHVFQNYGPGVRYIRFTHGGNDTQFWKGWYGIRVTDSCVELFPVPLEILEEIFLNLPADQVVCICRLVCHQWKEVADSESLWRERCRREGYRLCDASKIPKDWRLFYFLCKKRRNLLKNPRGEHKMKNWQILENGGDGWKVEGVMVPHPNEKVQKNFVTSYGMCKKSQLIHLEMEGYNPLFMDDFQPDIKISDWYAPRWDCGSEYEIRVELLNQQKKSIQTFAPETVYFEQWNDQKWNQMTHVFQNYGPGVRYIRFTHGGKDTQFWAEWYGIRVTDSCVEICPAIVS